MPLISRQRLPLVIEHATGLLAPLLTVCAHKYEAGVAGFSADLQAHTKVVF